MEDSESDDPPKLTSDIIEKVRAKAKSLNPEKRRAFQLKLLDECNLSPRQAERLFGWGRAALEKALEARREGDSYPDDRRGHSGRRRTERNYPNIREAIIIHLLKARIFNVPLPTASDIHNQLITDPKTREHVPTIRTIRTMMARLNNPRPSNNRRKK